MSTVADFAHGYKVGGFGLVCERGEVRCWLFCVLCERGEVGGAELTVRGAKQVVLAPCLPNNSASRASLEKDILNESEEPAEAFGIAKETPAYLKEITAATQEPVGVPVQQARFKAMAQPIETSIQTRSSEGATSQPMDISDNEEDKDTFKLNEDQLRSLQKVNSIQCIEEMRIMPKEDSRFDIPLCRMIYMPLVRPTLTSDIKRLEVEFTHGYRPGAPVFYVSTTDMQGGERLVSDVDTSNWRPHWTAVNDEFEAKLVGY